MSLLDQYKKPYVIVEKTEVSDGEGGSVTTWIEGAEISIAEAHDTTVEAQVAEANTTVSTYTFLISKGTSLKYGDVVKRVEDGQTFEITQPSNEDVTPMMSRLNLSKVTARKWEVGT